MKFQNIWFHGVQSICCAVCFWVLLTLPCSAAEEKSLTVFEGDDAKRILAITSNLPWVADGPDTGRHMYVFYAPWCEVCKDLYEKNHHEQYGVQLRWILVDGDCSYHAMYEDLSLGALERSFANLQPVLKDTEKVRRQHTYSLTGIYTLIANLFITDENGEVGFPTCLFGTDEKVFIERGLPDDLAPLFALVPQRNVQPARLPDAVRFALQEPAPMTLVEGVEHYQNDHDKPTVIRLAPFADAVRIGSFKPGKVLLPVTGVDANGFVYLDIGRAGKGPYLYVEDALFAEKMRAGK